MYCDKCCKENEYDIVIEINCRGCFYLDCSE